MLSRREFGAALTAPLTMRRTYGSEIDERLHYGIQYSDSYLMVGEKGGQGWLIQTDENGEIFRSKVIEGTERLNTILSTDGSGFIVGGEGDGSGVIKRFDSGANNLWTTKVDTRDVRSLVVKSGRNGDYMYSGFDNNQIGVVGSISAEGDRLLSTNVRKKEEQDITINKLFLSPESSVLYAGRDTTGSAKNGIVGSFSKGWQTILGQSDNSELYSIDLSSNGHVVAAGVTGGNQSKNGWIVRIDPNGGKVWEQTTSGNDAAFFDVYSLHRYPVNGSGFLCVGRKSGGGYVARYNEFGELQGEQIYNENRSGVFKRMISSPKNPLFIGSRQSNNSIDGWALEGSYNPSAKDTEESTNTIQQENSETQSNPGTPERGFFSNNASDEPNWISNTFNLTVFGFLLSVVGILHQMLKGE